MLVFDVGGGTSDFSLIQITEEDGQLVLERIAVGEHLLVGGDNMDLALARLCEEELGSGRLDIIATDHAPHTVTAKERTFAHAPGLGHSHGFFRGTLRRPHLLQERPSARSASPRAAKYARMTLLPKASGRASVHCSKLPLATRLAPEGAPVGPPTTPDPPPTTPGWLVLVVMPGRPPDV